MIGCPAVQLRQSKSGAKRAVFAYCNAAAERITKRQTYVKILAIDAIHPTSKATAVNYNGDVFSFEIGADGNLYNDYWNGTSWRGWQSLGQPSGVGLVGDPTAIVYDSAIYVFARGSDGALYSTNSSQWTTWQPHDPPSDVPFVGDPAAVIYTTPQGAQILFLYAIGSDGKLYIESFDGTTWGTTWSPLGPSDGAILVGTPAVVFDSPDIFVLARGADGNMYDDYYNGSSWSGFQDPSQQSAFSFVGDPTVVSLNGLEFFYAIGSDGNLYNISLTISQNLPQWGTWSPLGYQGVTLVGVPSVVNVNGNLYVYAVGVDADGKLYNRVWVGGTWGSWGPLLQPGVSLVGYPTAAPDEYVAGNVFVFVVGTDDVMYSEYWNGMSWTLQSLT